MTYDLRLDATKCPHGVWHAHNALRDDETGEVFDDPEGPCDGGRVITGDGRTFRISMGLAMTLDRLAAP